MLLPKIERFLRDSGMPWTKFGRLVAHDPRLVHDMRLGRTPRPAMAARITRFIAAYPESLHAR
ncbi:MAG: hypothetical protein JSS36_12220 [Proteobacteria bacterium]|nr:hypothetical protein [Pseudomonadota bacterium]